MRNLSYVNLDTEMRKVEWTPPLYRCYDQNQKLTALFGKFTAYPYYGNIIYVPDSNPASCGLVPSGGCGLLQGLGLEGHRDEQI